MTGYQQKLQVRWSDLDPNFHLRHSVYYDWGAQCRVNYLYDRGIDSDTLTRLHIGPILFREECVFKKEIRFSDDVSIELKALKAKQNFSRWVLQHTIRKADIVAAILTVEIAWIDTVKRKLAVLPEDIIAILKKDMPMTDNFEWLD